MGARIPVVMLKGMVRVFRWCARKVQAALANRTANRRTRARPSSAVSSLRPQSMKKAIPYGMKVRPVM
jgi:hypothetical protein